MNNRSEPGYTCERRTGVRRVPGADFRSEPGVRTRRVEFIERPPPPEIVYHPPNRYSRRSSQPSPPPQIISFPNRSDKSEDSDDVSDTDSVDGFPFYAPSMTESDIETVDESTSNGKTESFLDVQALHDSPTQDVYSFEFSRYHEEEDHGTDVYADFVHRSSSTKTAARTQPIFQWVHLKPTVMDFEAFCKTATSLPNLSENEVDEVRKLLQRVQKRGEKSFSTREGPEGRVLESIVHCNDAHDKEVDVSNRIIFCHLPYFTLEKYSTTSSTQSHLHPSRGLISSRYPSTSKSRELLQAVCHLAGTPTDHCFNVSGLWCLTIKDKYLPTCCRQLSANQIHGDQVTIEKLPPSNPSPATSAETKVLQVMFEDALYLIPLDQCNTWFKLTQLFSVFTYRFDDKFSVHWKGRQVASVQWPSIITLARKRSTRIFVAWRKRFVSRPLSKALPVLDDDDVLSDSAASRSSTPDLVSASTSLDSTQTSRGHIRPGSIDSPDRTGRPSRGRMSVITEFLQTPGSPSNTMPDILTRKPSSSPMSAQTYLQDFHALRWVALQLLSKGQDMEQSDVSNTTPRIRVSKGAIPLRKSHDEKVDAYLLESHKYMENNKVAAVRNIYRKRATKSLRDVELALGGMLRAKLDEPDVLEYKERLVTAAKSIFYIFLPLDQKGTICAKFWGALHSNITGPMDGNGKELKRAIEILTSTATRAIKIQAQLSKGKGPDPMEIRLPSAIVKAWYHFLICQLQWHPYTMETAHKQALKCQRQLNQAYHLIVQTFEGKKLNELRAVLPAEFIIFLLKRALQDFTKQQPNILESYWDYYTEMEMSAREEPSSRLHQSKIACFLDETLIVRTYLRKQYEVVSGLLDCLSPNHDSSDTGSSRDRFHFTLIRECMTNIQARLDTLSELRRKARGLADMNQRHRESTKDRQEGAIYVFTIVTIIFLPVSTISSIFGMNTNDIRNNQRGQWVFWASAIPVTVVVLVASLFGAEVLSLSSVLGLKGGYKEEYTHLPDYGEVRLVEREGSESGDDDW